MKNNDKQEPNKQKPLARTREEYLKYVELWSKRYAPKLAVEVVHKGW